MVTTDVEHELRIQLKEAGRLLSNPPAAMETLLHILDQLEKLLSMVDQSPDSLMQEALKAPMKALVDGNLLEHPDMDVKVSVASCLSEITRITAPDAPYSDEEMKRVFQCIVSSLDDLSDQSSACYAKRLSILETVSKVRSCVVMLDLECDDLIVKLFEHFLSSVRDHHLGNVFSLMVNIMALVLEESEDVSHDILKPLLASVKINSEGVLPVARNLGEEVIKRSAEKLRPYVNKAVTILGDSLADYSQVLTSICERTTDLVQHNDESASMQPKVDTMPAIVSLDDAAQVISNGEMVTENVDDNPSKKAEGAGEDLGSNLTRKLVTEKDVNADPTPDTTTTSAKPPVDVEKIGEKISEVILAVEKPSASEVAMARIKKGARSTKRGPNQTDPASTLSVLTPVVESMSDQELRSPKRARKKTLKAVDNKLQVTSDAEPLKNLGEKVETGVSGPKPAKRSRKKVVDSVAKLSGKKVSESNKSKQDNKKVVEAGDSEVKPVKQSGKRRQRSKVVTKPIEDVAVENKDEETDSDITPLKLSENKQEKADSDHRELNLSESKDDEETDSDNIPLKMSAKRILKNSSVVKSSSKNKDGNKQERSKTVQEKETKSLSEDDDGMDVSLKSVLKKVTGGKGKVEGDLSTGSKRKRSVTKKKVTETVKYDDSLVGQKIKVWWPHDKMYYEGVVGSFESATKKHKILYVDGDEELLNLKNEKWEILKKFSKPIKKVAADAQKTDVLPEIADSSKGESKDTSKDVEQKEDEKEETPKKIVYSRGRKAGKRKSKASDGKVKEAEAVDAEGPGSEKDPQSGSKTAKKRKTT